MERIWKEAILVYFNIEGVHFIVSLNTEDVMGGLFRIDVRVRWEFKVCSPPAD